MQRRLTNQDLTWILDLNSNGRLDLDPRYQRRSVWTRRDRQFFLDTIFNGYPSPALFLHKDLDDYGNATYRVVDGKQRIETILMFVRNELPIPSNFGDAALNGKRWRDLAEDRQLKKTFYDYQFTVEMLDTVETTIINEVFSRLNRNSTRLTPQELRHARFDGWFITRAEQEAELPVWKDIRLSTPARIRRMQDVQFISELMITVIEKRVLGFDQAKLDEYYARYNDPEDLDPPFDTEEFSTEFERVSGYLGELERTYKTVSRYATSLANLYSLSAYLSTRKELPDLPEFSERYGRFMEEVANYQPTDSHREEANIWGRTGAVATYFDASRGASTDYGPRQRRHEALELGLNPSMEKDEDVF